MPTSPRSAAIFPPYREFLVRSILERHAARDAGTRGTVKHASEKIRIVVEQFQLIDFERGAMRADENMTRDQQADPCQVASCLTGFLLVLDVIQ